MKTLKMLALAICSAAALFLSACADSPSDVVEKYKEAEANFDYAAMKNLTTGGFTEVVEMGEAVYKAMSDADKKEVREAGKAGKAEIIKEEVDGSNATVTIKENGIKSNLLLIKVDGEWKINGMELTL